MFARGGGRGVVRADRRAAALVVVVDPLLARLERAGWPPERAPATGERYVPQSPRTALPFSGQPVAAHSKAHARHTATRLAGAATILLASRLAQHLDVDDRCTRWRRAARSSFPVTVRAATNRQRRSGRRMSTLAGENATHSEGRFSMETALRGSKILRS